MIMFLVLLLSEKEGERTQIKTYLIEINIIKIMFTTFYIISIDKKAILFSFSFK